MRLKLTQFDLEDGPERRWIIVADGSSDEAQALACRLLDAGFLAFPTVFGAEALQVAKTRAVDAAVVDVELLDMDGLRLVAKLREIHPELAVIMTSRQLHPRIEDRAHELGVAQYIHKPVSAQHVARALADVLVGQLAGVS